MVWYVIGQLQLDNFHLISLDNSHFGHFLPTQLSSMTVNPQTISPGVKLGIVPGGNCKVGVGGTILQLKTLCICHCFLYIFTIVTEVIWICKQ